MSVIDLRSDTVSLPTEEMLEAMKNAELGDDILGDDPTVKQLETIAAETFGKEAALLTPSGTMSNQIAVMVYTERGQEVIVGKESHIYNLEVAALSTLSQVQVRTLSCPKGFMDPNELEYAIQKAGIQTAQTGLVCLENTYNLNKGLVMKEENLAEIAAICQSHSIPVYMDGARIFNASVKSGKNVHELVEDVDAVQVCLTKGLSAPIGSLLIGDQDFITEARRIRQRLGGGMRQAGVIAAAGIVGFEKMIHRLEEDNRNARILAEKLSKIDARLVNVDEVETNILSLNLGSLGVNSEKFWQMLNEQDIKIKRIGTHEFRMVTHRQITPAHIEKVANCISKILYNRNSIM